jgi:hypothetical protein
MAEVVETIVELVLGQYMCMVVTILFVIAVLAYWIYKKRG